MTILPKKKPPGGSKNEPETVEGGGGGYQLGLPNNQGSEELLFVAGNVSPDARWGVVRGESRPPSASPSHWSSSGSPPHWSSSAGSVGSREEKRHSSSPLHPHHEDSLDAPPAPKRARQSHSRGLSNGVGRHQGGSRNKPYSVTAATVVNVVPSCSSQRVQSPPPASAEDDTGYNSEDEYSHIGVKLTDEEWSEKDRRFDRNMRRQGYLIKKMGEDGACLFRAVADQLFGDEEMHRCVRAQCMDYLESNRDYFEQYVTEPFEEYVTRKRFYQVHGNHLEIQAMSELYNRPIHIYCYSAEPINIFQCVSRNNHEIAVPLRLSYQRGIHYNSIVDPNNTAIGVGLGLPGLKPGLNKADLVSVLSKNDNNLTEKQMLEDKIKFTDWEATNEAIEEHVARESYMLWIQDQERKPKNPRCPGSAQSQLSPRGASGTSSPKPSSPRPLGATSPRPRGAPSPRPLGASSPRPLQATSPRPLQATSPRPHASTGASSPLHHLGCNSSNNGSSPRPQTRAATASTAAGHVSPKAGCSSQQDNGSSGESPKPGSSRGGEAGCSSRLQETCSGTSSASSSSSSVDHGLGPGFQLRETASYLNGLPIDLLGFDDLDGDSILRRVMLESQQEYLNSLKRQAQEKDKS
jgi:OTU domain-containing protein 5